MSKHTASQDSPDFNLEQPESIQSKGGKARAKKLSPERLSSIASQAATLRWLPKSTHKGNFKDEFGIDAECYVLNDQFKTAVISQMGMGRALGLAPRGNAFPRFLKSKAMTETLGAQLADKLVKPLKFQYIGSGAQGGIINGFDVTLLIDVCKAILEAEPLLDRQQKHVADQARVIVGASAKAGIKGLVYALAGYNPTSAEVIAAFKMYVQEEARKYEKEFPPEIYLQWHRLYEIPPIQGRGRPWHFKHLTLKHVYGPLAQSNGKVLQLTKALKSASGDRKAKLFQFLSEVGTRALRFHLGRLVEMAESSKNKSEYDAKILERFGGQQELDLAINEAVADPTPPTAE